MQLRHSFFVFLILFMVSTRHVKSQFTCNPTCVAPQMCDFNTGICRTFRTAFNGPVFYNCPACPSGTTCDTNTGQCQLFRNG